MINWTSIKLISYQNIINSLGSGYNFDWKIDNTYEKIIKKIKKEKEENELENKKKKSSYINEKKEKEIKDSYKEEDNDNKKKNAATKIHSMVRKGLRTNIENKIKLKEIQIKLVVDLIKTKAIKSKKEHIL